MTHINNVIHVFVSLVKLLRRKPLTGDPQGGACFFRLRRDIVDFERLARLVPTHTPPCPVTRRTKREIHRLQKFSKISYSTRHTFSTFLYQIQLTCLRFEEEEGEEEEEEGEKEEEEEEEEEKLIEGVPFLCLSTHSCRSPYSHPPTQAALSSCTFPESPHAPEETSVWPLFDVPAVSCRVHRNMYTCVYVYVYK
jgi:hypothetical protein